MKRIILDIDGVLAAFNRPFAELLIAQGANLRPFEYEEDPTCWDWPQAYGATPQQEANAWLYIHQHPQWWRSLPRHAQFTGRAMTEKLGHLCDDHEVTFITKRPNGRAETMAWLAARGVRDPQVILVPGSKADLIDLLEVDVVIEDNIRTLQALWMADAAPRLILVDRPYNMDANRSGLDIAFTTGEALEMAARA